MLRIIASVYNACTYSCLLTTTQPYLRCYCVILAPTCCYLLLFATTFRSTTATSSSTNTTCCYVPTTRKPPRLRPFQVTPTTLKSRTRGKEKRDLRRVDKARKRLLLGFSAFNTHTLVVKQKPFACMQLTLFLLCSRKQAKASHLHKRLCLNLTGGKKGVQFRAMHRADHSGDEKFAKNLSGCELETVRCVVPVQRAVQSTTQRPF